MSSRSQPFSAKQEHVPFDYSETAASEDDELLLIERSPETHPVQSTTAANLLQHDFPQLSASDSEDTDDAARVISSPPAASATPAAAVEAAREPALSPLPSPQPRATSPQESMLGSMVLLEPISTPTNQPAAATTHTAAINRTRFDKSGSFLPYNRCTSTSSWWMPLLYSRGSSGGSAPPSKPRWLLFGAVVVAAVVGFASYIAFGHTPATVSGPSNALTRSYVTSQHVIHHPRYSRA